MLSHPTRERLIESVISLSKETDFEQIIIEQALSHSGVSRGSLYHHFENFDELIGAAMARSFAVGVDRSIAYLNEMLSDCDSVEDFVEGLQKSIAQTLAPDGIEFRLNRARIIGLSGKHQQLRRYIDEEQKRLSGALEGLFIQAQRSGWVRDDLDVRATVLFIQAYTFGKLIDDISYNPIDTTRWSNYISAILTEYIVNE